MSLYKKALALYGQFGKPVKFAVKLVLNALLPGSPLIVELVEHLLDGAQEISKGLSKEPEMPPATTEDLRRVENVLDMLAGDLRVIVAQIAELEGLPEIADRILAVTIQVDSRLQSVMQRLDAMAQQFDHLADQNKWILTGQQKIDMGINEVLGLLKAQSGLAEFAAEMRAADLDPREFRDLLQRFQRGTRFLGSGKLAEAQAEFEALAKKRPQSPSAAVALAGAEAANGDLKAAEKCLARATRLVPGNANLSNLHKGMTRLGGVAPHPIDSKTSPLPDLSIGALRPIDNKMSPLPDMSIGTLLKQHLNRYGTRDLAVAPMMHQQTFKAGSGSDVFDTYALVTLIPTVGNAEKQPLNVAFVVDVSGSMYEEDGTNIPRLKRVQDAALSVIQELKPTDTMTIVAFAHNALTLLPPTAISEKDKIEEVIKKIDMYDIDPGGTAMNDGMRYALDEIGRNAGAQRNSLVVIFSDGRVGDQEEMGRLGGWEIPERAKLAMRQEAERNCQSMAQWANGKVALTLIGIGLDCNSQLLAEMASLSGGDWCYWPVDKKQFDYGVSLIKALEASRVAMFGHVEMHLKPMKDIKVKGLWQVAPEIRRVNLESLEERHLRAATSDFASNKGVRYLIEFSAPTRPEGKYFIAQFEVQYTLLGTRKTTGPLPLEAQYSADFGYRNALVERYRDLAIGIG